MGEKGSTFWKDEKYNILTGKSEGKGRLGRPRSRWEYIRMDLRRIGWEVMNWIHVAQDRDQWQDLVMNLRIP
jgi:hypothetical protein